MYWDYNYITRTVPTTRSITPIEPYSGGVIGSGQITEIPPTVNLFPESQEPPPPLPQYEEGKWYEKREVLIGGIALVVLVFGSILFLPKSK